MLAGFECAWEEPWLCVVSGWATWSGTHKFGSTKRERHPRRLHVRPQTPYSAVSPDESQKTVAEGVMCGQWDGIVFLRIIGEANSCLAQISFFAMDHGFHPQFEFSVSRKKAWMI